MVGNVERDAFGFAGDSRVAGRTPQLGQQRRAGNLPGQGMLAAAGTDQENVRLSRRR
jgi:hypothetical protein